MKMHCYTTICAVQALYILIYHMQSLLIIVQDTPESPRSRLRVHETDMGDEA